MVVDIRFPIIHTLKITARLISLLVAPSSLYLKLLLRTVPRLQDWNSGPFRRFSHLLILMPCRYPHYSQSALTWLLPSKAIPTDSRYSEEKPFVYRDTNLQVCAVWHQRQVHGSDWMYFAWMSSCPKDSDPIVVAVADPWGPLHCGLRI